MQNLSIPPHVNSPASPAVTPANADISSTNNQSNGTFSKIMEQEVSNNAVMSQQDNSAALEAHATTVTSAATTKNSGNPRLVLENLLQGELSENPAIATGNEGPTFGLEVYVPHANMTDHIPVIEQTQQSDIPAVTITQTITPMLTQPAPAQKFHANYVLGQPYYTANSAATNKIMPPSAETIRNNIPPSAEITTFTLTSESTQFTVSDSTALVTATAPSSSTQSTAPTPAVVSLDAQLGQPKWEGEFAQKIVWLAGQQQQVAEIRLNPAHLGPIEIMLSISNDQGAQQATAQFLSSHLAVREAIEAALPKLREMMADNGITLGNVTVDSNSSQQQKDTWQQEHAAKRFAVNQPGAHSESPDQLETTIVTQSHLGIVNTFA